MGLQGRWFLRPQQFDELQERFEFLLEAIEGLEGDRIPLVFDQGFSIGTEGFLRKGGLVFPVPAYRRARRHRTSPNMLVALALGQLLESLVPYVVGEAVADHVDPHGLGNFGGVLTQQAEWTTEEDCEDEGMDRGPSPRLDRHTGSSRKTYRIVYNHVYALFSGFLGQARSKVKH